MNISRTFRRTIHQMTYLEIMANIVHENQLHNCSRIVRRTIRQTYNTSNDSSHRIHVAVRHARVRYGTVRYSNTILKFATIHTVLYGTAWLFNVYRTVRYDTV